MTDATSREVSSEERSALARMVMRAFDHWGLDTCESTAMLGFAAADSDRLSIYRDGAPFPDQRDLLDRAGHILAIHKGLRLVFPHQRHLAYRWMRTPNQAFDRRTPAEVVFEEGFQGLLQVRGYLDQARA